MPAAKDPAGAGASLRGATTYCALLTVLTVALAWPGLPPTLAALVPPAYFGLLAWFFARTAAASPELRGQAMTLLVAGFGIRCAGAATSAIIAMLPPADSSLLAYARTVCDDGAVFLLGTTLSTFGLMLWIPHVLQNLRTLQESTARQRDQLDAAASERSLLEHHLVEADRRGMLAELAASIAHDLRNPLTIVKGTAESLCRRPRTMHELAEHTAVIQRNVDKADRTIAALIDLARPQAQAAADVSPLQALDEVAGLLQTEARRRRIDLHVDRCAAFCPPVHTDRTLLSQALLNLALNALQATPAGRRVTLRARPWRRRDAVVFAVDDRGDGFDAAARAQLFTPFFTTKPDGTGLGLVSCRRIAAELGGGLRLQNRTGGGARATLALPRRPAAAPAKKEAPCATSSC